MFDYEGGDYPYRAGMVNLYGSTCHFFPKKCRTTFDFKLIILFTFSGAPGGRQKLGTQNFITWEVKLAWDSPLPLGLCNKFDKWFKDILLLQNLEIPRYCEINSDSDLHVFVDASKEAYTASIFVRTKLASGIKLHLLRAKARVAPTKSVSMPRLELLACCVGARLANSFINSLDIPDLKVTYWSSPMVALHWIKNNGNGRFLFGVCSSPFLLAASINHLLDNTPSKYMDIVSKLRHSFYVDNCVTGVSDTQEIGSFVNKVRKIMSNGCFSLRGWESNVKKNLFRNVREIPRTKLVSGIKLHLLRAKARVAPTKSASMPRLELLACCVGARLANSIRNSLDIPDLKITYWSDSTVALHWIKNNGKWSIFVSNRIKEISRISSPENWRHVPGRMNPADVLSRGCSPRHLLESKWFGGPEWLLGDAVTCQQMSYNVRLKFSIVREEN
ncbi:uncharacterized protein TNCV_2469991 [Trichonephila clavipes]|nr:uncharacterized protein TNCV_2469991 [Trichonephila clavipes]